MSGITPDEFPWVMESPNGIILLTALASGANKMFNKEIMNINKKKCVRSVIFCLVLMLAQIGWYLNELYRIINADLTTYYDKTSIFKSNFL